ncbi:hypothetical protein ABGB17_16470 [Sphaerisporangium sp. B11E5]|uniref:hypothetical protein n=1 Tax=Sphaerisporangium sp. B11E5 TaxID=3153563 RepID=UPI00325D85F4
MTPRTTESAMAMDIAAGTRPHLDLPLIGRVWLPAPDRVAFYGALGVPAALQLIERPVALLVGIGHLLADQHHSNLLRGIGQAAESA